EAIDPERDPLIQVEAPGETVAVGSASNQPLTTITSRTLVPYTCAVSPILQSLKCCLNPKVLIGLAAAGVAVVLLAPNLIAGAFPLLLALVCPLSMLAMMVGMARMGTKDKGSQASASNVMTTSEAPKPSMAVSADARLA